jgi:hypothetical protein
MNYSRNIKRTSIGKRILLSWLVVALVFLIVGGIAVALLKPDTSTTDVVIYDKPDGKIFSGEMSEPWESDLNFISLDVPMDADLQEFTYYLSSAYDIDFTLVMAIIKQESNFDATVQNGNNYGLMQINEVNKPLIKQNLEISDIQEPYNNIRSGLFILRKLFEKYETPERVLMAYNMGEKAASQLWEQGVFESNYSRSVLLIQNQYQEEIQKSGDAN